MKARCAFALLLIACEPQQAEVAAEEAPVEAASLEVDPALLRELLGEAVRVEGDQIRADGMLIRLAFDPLIRKTGPVSVQLVQGQGYRLTGIADGSPLWLLGLRDGDVLTGVDKQAIIGREHELRSSYEARPSRVELTYMRGSEAHTVVVRIASGSAWRSTAELPELPTASTRVAPISESTIDVVSGIHCVAAAPDQRSIGRCEIERKTIDGLLASPASLAPHARIVPAIKDGQTLGYKLYGIRPNSLYKLLGFKNGDLVRSVNGREIDNIDTAMATYEQLRTQSEFRVVFERRDQPRELEIVFVDKLSGPPGGLHVSDTESPDLRDPFKLRR
jgi:hypothetical protein